MDNAPTDILRRAALWTAICSISAAPSFFWAINVNGSYYNRLAMATGVVCFICLLTATTSTPRFLRFRKHPFIRRTLYIGYGARLFISIVFPLGAWLDLFPGMLSIGIVEEGLGIPGSSYLGTLLITLIQGTFLNCLIFILMAITYGVQRLFLTMPPPESELACSKCGYDLRGSLTSVTCPECGANIESDITAASV